MLTTNDSGRIINVQTVNNRLLEYKPTFFKCAGIHKLKPEYAKQLAAWLDEDVTDGKKNIFYDLVIASRIEKLPIFAYDINGLRWAEIDNLEDLRQAEAIFDQEMQ